MLNTSFNDNYLNFSDIKINKFSQPVIVDKIKENIKDSGKNAEKLNNLEETYLPPRSFAIDFTDKIKKNTTVEPVALSFEQISAVREIKATKEETPAYTVHQSYTKYNEDYGNRKLTELPNQPLKELSSATRQQRLEMLEYFTQFDTLEETKSDQDRCVAAIGVAAVFYGGGIDALKFLANKLKGLTRQERPLLDKLIEKMNKDPKALVLNDIAILQDAYYSICCERGSGIKGGGLFGSPGSFPMRIILKDPVLKEVVKDITIGKIFANGKDIRGGSHAIIDIIKPDGKRAIYDPNPRSYVKLGKHIVEVGQVSDNPQILKAYDSVRGSF